MPKVLRLAPDIEIHHWPCVVEVWRDGEKLIAFTIEEWAAAADFVGVRLISAGEALGLLGLRDSSPTVTRPAV